MNIKDLKIYQIASKLRKEIYQEIPDNWKIDSIQQIKRASASIAANIAEGFSRKYYKKDFLRFLSFAIGSSDECQNHTKALYESKHISKEKSDYLQKSFKDLFIRIINYRNRIKSALPQKPWD